jgi:hypothetical protein
VNFNEGLCADGAANVVVGRLGVDRALAILRLRLREPYHVGADKQQNDERRASNNVRHDGSSKRPFIHS